MPKSPIVGPWSVSRSKNAADNNLINLGVEIIETKDGKVPAWLYLMPGLDLLNTLGNGPIRGIHPLAGSLYVVSGAQVFSLSANAVSALLGTISIAATPVAMFDNGVQLCIFDGQGGWTLPGGYPLTGGTIGGTPQLYAVGDTVDLAPASGRRNATPRITITAISNSPAATYTTAVGGQGYAINDTGRIPRGTGDANYKVTGVGAGGAVTTYTLTSAGTTYNSGVNVQTARGGSQPGQGVGLVLNITASSGPITGSTLGTPGGTTYTTATGAATNRGGQQPGGGTGLTLDVTASSGPISASSINNPGTGYAVNDTGLISGGTGDAVYQILTVGPTGNVTAFIVTLPGAISAPTASFTQLATSGSGSGLQITFPTFGSFIGIVPLVLPFSNPTTGTVIDGFGLATQAGSQNIWQSNELDLSIWDPLNYGVSDESPDFIVALAALHDQAYVVKQTSTEVWVDAGTAGFAFAPLSGAHQEKGCYAPFSVAKVGESLCWLAQSKEGIGEVVRTEGYQLKTISTQALTAEFNKYANLGDAIGYAYQVGGHTYYVLTFPEADATWCYDATASALAGVPVWSRLAAWTNGQWMRHWGNAFARFAGGALGGGGGGPVMYCANPVTITSPSLIETAGPLAGVAAFTAAVFSAWVLIPDGSQPSGLIFANQGALPPGSPNGGLLIQIANDSSETPQIEVSAWDASNDVIVSATYDFATWATWVNVAVSIDTATQQLQVYATTQIGGSKTIAALTPVSLTWSSTNAVANPAGQGWYVQPLAESGGPATWDATNALSEGTANPSYWTLSNGDLTAASSFGNGIIDPTQICATNQQATGKFYFEITFTGSVGLRTAVGLNATLTAPYGSYGIYLFGNSGQLWDYGSERLNSSSLEMSSGCVVCVAVNLTSNLIWVRINNGNWNASGSANPATSTGGASIANRGTTAVSPMVGSTGTFAANFGASSFTYSVPAGFTAGWATSAVVTSTASVADLWFSPTAAFLDLSVQANLNLFVANNGGTQWLGNQGQIPTGTQPPVFLTVPTGQLPAAFAANTGSGGGFAITGALTTAPSRPPCAEIVYGDPTLQTIGPGAVGVVGDYRNGNLYAFDPAALTDAGTARRWLRTWRALPAATPSADRFSYLAVGMQTGAAVPDGANPQCVLRWSDDGGSTWSNERIQPVGMLGQTGASVKFNRLGSTRRFGSSDRIFELSSTDQFMTAILDADLEGS